MLIFTLNREIYMWFDNLKEKRLWSYFNDISSIPRESGNEEGVRRFLLKWAEKNGISAVQDRVGNVIMKKGATPGYENCPAVALQGHMDMVCVKREGSKHDFRTDPIEIVCDGKYISAKDTSLGGDDGIAVATMLDILSDDTLEHGPIECICTVNEEVGLTGAFGLEEKYVSARQLINLDSEEENIFYIGCAGGVDVEATRAINRIKFDNSAYKAVDIEISGLLGGHSGGDIHRMRANAIKVFGRYLSLLPQSRIVSAKGGTKRNVIPSHLKATILVCSIEEAVKAASKLQEDLRVEYCKSDPDITITVKENPEGLSDYTVPSSVNDHIKNILICSPSGVQAYSQTLPGLVETSCNLAILDFGYEKAKVVYSVRSSIESAKLSVATTIRTLCESNGFTVEVGDGYPGWLPNPESALTAKLAAEWEKYTGEKPEITAIHAGLECGIINSKIEGMDSVSIGPNMYDIHSVNEKLDIASAEKMLGFLRASIKDLK